jgi:stearoyl-CoA desaturase (delta-9 desaturase)
MISVLKENAPIIKYGVIWGLGLSGVICAAGYALYHQEYLYWLISYIYFRVLWFFTNGIALHKYFAHRSFKTGPKRHKFLSWVTVLGGVGSPYMWAIQHRHHHQHSDTELDLHSPKENKLKAAIGFWVLSPIQWWTDVKQVKPFLKDLHRDSTVMFIHRHYYKIWMTILTASVVLFGLKFTVFFVLAPIGWNFLHSALTNWLNHTPIFGSYRNYDTDDHSQNHKWINVFLLGEGMHNNHHAFPSNYNQNHRDGEFDLSGVVIKKFFDVSHKI